MALTLGPLYLREPSHFSFIPSDDLALSRLWYRPFSSCSIKKLSSWPSPLIRVKLVYLGTRVTAFFGVYSKLFSVNATLDSKVWKLHRRRSWTISSMVWSVPIGAPQSCLGMWLYVCVCGAATYMDRPWSLALYTKFSVPLLSDGYGVIAKIPLIFKKTSNI